jgi:hypothetical protein
LNRRIMGGRCLSTDSYRFLLRNMFALQNIGQHDNALLITVGFSSISISIERVQNSFCQPGVSECANPLWASYCHSFRSVTIPREKPEAEVEKPAFRLRQSGSVTFGDGSSPWLEYPDLSSFPGGWVENKRRKVPCVLVIKLVSTQICDRLNMREGKA